MRLDDAAEPFTLNFATLGGTTGTIVIQGTETIATLLEGLRHLFGATSLSLCLPHDYDSTWTLAHLIQHHQFDTTAITRVYIETAPTIMHVFARFFGQDITLPHTPLTLSYVPLHFADDESEKVIVCESNALQVAHNVSSWTMTECLTRQVGPVTHPYSNVIRLLLATTPLPHACMFKLIFEHDLTVRQYEREDTFMMALGQFNEDMVNPTTEVLFNINLWTERPVIDTEQLKAFENDTMENMYLNGVTALDVAFCNQQMRTVMLCHFNAFTRTLTIRHPRRPSIRQVITALDHPQLLVGMNILSETMEHENIKSTITIDVLTDEEKAIFDLSTEVQLRNMQEERMAEVADYAARQVQVEVERVRQNIVF